MVGWKCDVGIYPHSSIPNTFPISDVIFTDKDVFYPLYTGDLSVVGGNGTAEKAYEYMQECTGSADTFYSICCLQAPFDSNMDNNLNIFISWLPSVSKLFPNLWAKIKSTEYGNMPKTVVYFKQFNKLFLIWNNDVTSAMYDVSNGTCNQYANTLWTILHPIRFDATYGYTYLPIFDNSKEISQEQLCKNGNFVNYQIQYYRGGNYYTFYKQSNNDNAPYFFNWLFNNGYLPPDADIPVNPYEPGGPSGPGDLPPGTFDDDSDPIPDSSLPTLSAANTGFTRIYNPTLSQVQDLAQYLWTTPDIIETIWNHIKQFFENPMDAIIGFNLVPVPVPDGGTENFKLMYIDTGVAMTAAANQFVDRDCGTVEIKRYYGSALDQSPYTKVSCFLPYIGTVQLNTDEVMGTTLQVKYRVDICSGSCVAKIFIDGNCLYQYSGHCAINIPISSADFSSYVSAAINVAKLAVGAATAGAGGVAGAAMVAQDISVEQQTHAAFGMEDVPSPSNITMPMQTQSSQSYTPASFAGLSPSSVSNTVGEIMNAKPHVEHSGSFSGNTGYLGVRRPFIIIERPNMCMPANYQALNGFPAMITMELGTCKGFTRVQQVQLTGMTATNPEQAEILELLKSGVVL